MKKNNPSDGILVYDRYYGRKPVTALLIAERILFCTLLCSFSMMYIISEYYFPVPLSFVAAASAVFSVLLSVLFIFVKRRIAVPVLLAAAAGIAWHNLDRLWERLSCFTDMCMLLVEGRFLFPRQYTIHQELRVIGSPESTALMESDIFKEGMLIGTALLCFAFALVCAVSMKKRVRALPALFAFVLLLVPRLLSETLEYNIWLLFALLMYAAAFTIGIVYKNGLAVIRSGSGSYRRQVREDERRFLRNTRKAPFFKRTGMRFAFFSKYFTSGAYCAVLAFAAIGIGCIAFSEGESIDYSELYNAVHQATDSDSDFEQTAASDYFTSPKPEQKNHGLNISNPGEGNAPIIKVTMTGSKPLYLRGDIGVEFTGTGWTTHITDETLWQDSGLKEIYRPCEVDVLSVMLNALGSEYSSIIGGSVVNIDYLCETDVVFLPPYTAEYSGFDNENFDVYGDYAVRVNEAVGDYINSVQCNALFHSFYTHADLVERVEQQLAENSMSVNDFYSIVVPTMAAEKDVITRYGEYVDRAYLSIPKKTSEDIGEYIRYVPELKQAADDYLIGGDSAYSRYLLANTFSQYLSDNYQYSLYQENQGSSPVIEFLTETKKGHCSLYASSLTLMLREMGVPARYCTGFCVYPMSNGLTTRIMQEKNLHAWVEVYLGELGWVTFDPTSAAINELNNPTRPETSEQSSEEGTAEAEKPEKPTPNKPGETPTKPDNQNPADSPAEIPVGIILAAVCAVILAAAAVFVVWKYRSVKGRAEDYLLRCAVYNPKDVYARIVSLLSFKGKSPEAGQLPTEFYKAVDKEMGTTLSKHKALLLKCAFSEEQLSDSEAQIIAELLNQLYSKSLCKNPFANYRIRKIISGRS